MIAELLEPELQGLPVTAIREAVALSMAISLRRIAGAVARPSSRLAADAGLINDGTARRHHSVAEMAHECAAHHGVMILDVDREADAASTRTRSRRGRPMGAPFMTEAELGAAVGLVARCKRLETQFATSRDSPWREDLLVALDALRWRLRTIYGIDLAPLTGRPES
jgi:hypothetical protein